MNSADCLTTPSLDIGQILDEGPFSRFQQLVVALVAITVVIDGFDSQLIGFAIPSIAKELGEARSAFAPVVAAGLFGMGVGSGCAGFVGDRYGRRKALLGSVLLFAVATCTVGLAPSLLMIATLRFFAGLGIGGALPSATTLAAEFSPRRRRTLAVTATIVCVPLGGMFAGLFAGSVIPQLGWRPLFLIGGAMPVLFAFLLFFALPESPRFLARHRERWPELSLFLSRLMARPACDTLYTDQTEERLEQHKGFAALLKPDYRRDSIALWCAFFACMLAIYSAFSWLPTMLILAGLDTRVASLGLTAYNAGGVLGALLCALAIARFGSRAPLVACCAVGAASAFFLARLQLYAHPSLLIFVLGIHGLFVNAVQSTMYALCAHVYSTVVRATGTATAVMFGRLGAVTSSFAGTTVLGIAGPSGYLIMLGSVMILVLIAIGSVRSHVGAHSSFYRPKR